RPSDAIRLVIPGPARSPRRLRRLGMTAQHHFFAVVSAAFASWIVFQILYGVAGILMSRTPKSRSASTMALITTAGAAVVPPSPPALMPSGLVGESTSAISVANGGRVSARGNP